MTNRSNMPYELVTTRRDQITVGSSRWDERRATLEDNGDVVVIGGGLVGLACAYSLARSGLRPVVIDADHPGSGASSGNAGLVALAPEIVAPLPAPGVVRTSLRWLIQRDSPLHLAPRLDWDYLRWMGRFIVSCTPEAAEAGLHATLALNAETPELFDALEREGLEFEMERLGVLLVYRTRHSFESARKRIAERVDAGAGGRVLSRNEALAAEPLLASDACVGAIQYEADRQVRPDKLIDALVRRLKQMGVEIRDHCPCVELVCDGRTVIGARTPEGTFQGRSYVLTAGTDISRLARHAGVRIPIESGRGYSFDVARDELPLRTPVYLHDARLALTPFREFTRVAGMMELGARSGAVRPRAIETMNRVGEASFMSWPRKEARDAWGGRRPMTPDGLPVIGTLNGIENLYVAGGHGMLGLTLSLRTGKAIAELVGLGRCGDHILRPFAPDRFASSHNRHRELVKERP